MAEALTQPTPLPTELIERTECCWLRSPEVALGTYHEHEELFYWKWNLRNSRWRLTSLGHDKGLFQDSHIAPKFDSIRTQIIRYKPESRLVFQSPDWPGKLFKLYRPDKTEIARQRARIFADSFMHAVPLCDLIAGENRIDWRWIDGGPLSADHLHEGDRIVGLLQMNENGSRCGVPLLEPLTVARHISDRIEAHTAWMPILFPRAADELDELTRHWPQVAASLVGDKIQSPMRLLHGDFRPRNVVLAKSGQLYLCDSDHLCAGPFEWDLAAWAADLSFNNQDHAADLLANWFSLENVNAALLSNYFRAWRILIGLRSIEDRHL